jgi:hypothetical protein
MQEVAGVAAPPLLQLLLLPLLPLLMMFPTSEDGNYARAHCWSCNRRVTGQR